MQVSGTVALALVLALFILLPLSPAEAGQGYGLSFRCAPSGTSERFCYGSLRAARRSDGATDFIDFQLDGTGYLYVHASYGDVRYDCTFDRTSSASLAPAAMGDADVYFAIRMNAQGACLSNSFFTNSSTFREP